MFSRSGRESLSICAALCPTRTLWWQSPYPSGALIQLPKKCLKQETAANCLCSPRRVKFSFQSSCRQLYEGDGGGKGAQGQPVRMVAVLKTHT